MSTPDIDIVDYLVSAVTAESLVAGTNIFNSQVTPVGQGIPELAVFVFPIGGNTPERFLSSSVSRYESYLTVWIRGKKSTASGAHQQVLELARDIINKLNFDGAVTISGYHNVTVFESDPYFQAADDEGRIQCSVTISVEWFA